MPRLSLVALLLLGSNGCAIAPKNYVEPDSGSTARLIIQGPADRESSVAFYASAAKCAGRSFVNDIGPAGTKTVKVRADELLSLTFNQPGARDYRLNRTGCNITISFVPEGGQTYEAQMTTRASDQRCTVVILKRDRNGEAGNSPVLTFQRKEAVMQMTENSDWCQPM